MISSDEGLLVGLDSEETPPNMPHLDYFQLMAIENKQKTVRTVCPPHHLPKSGAQISLVQVPPSPVLGEDSDPHH